MITKKELNTVFHLTKKKENIEQLLRGFESNIITSKIGILGFSDSSGIHFDTNGDASFFHKALPMIEKELTERALVLIKTELRHVEADLSRYISDKKGDCGCDQDC